VGRIIAVIDQHAADERFRLERILETAESVPASLTFRLGQSEVATLERRMEALRKWIEVEIVEGMVRIVGIPKVLAKDIDSVPWREILTSYTAGGADECPPLLMNLLCSKACRSVPLPGPLIYPLLFIVVMGKKARGIDESRRLCLMIIFPGRSVRGLLDSWRGANGPLFVLTVDLVLRH
jgi:hypothetical protein